MTREEVLDIMFRVKTLADCKQAWAVRDAWLLQHPDDEAVLDEGEALYMHEQALKSMEDQKLRERVASAVST